MTLLPLNMLETSGLIRLAQMDPELEYLFRHALVQEAAYDSILKSDRKNLHLAVAHEMERIYPERLDELATLLANHYREAGETQKALEYYRRAAKYAFQKFANREAESNLRAALELCDNVEERAEIHHRMGIIIQTLGRLEEAEKFLRDSLPVYRANNNLEEIADVYGYLSQIAFGKNDVANSLAVAREGLQEVGELPPSEAYAELLRYVANGCIFSGLLDEAEAYLPKILAVAEKSGSKSALAQALITQALIQDRRGKTEEAIAALERAAVFGEKANHPLSVSRARNNLAFVLGKLGRYAEAAEQYESMIVYNRQASSIFGEIWFLTQLNGLFLDLGKTDEAVQLVTAMKDLLEANGGKTYRMQVEGARLQTLIYIGKPEEAIADLSSGQEDSLKHNDKQVFMNFSYTLSLAYVMLKEYDHAVQEMEKGIQGAGIWAGAEFQYLLAGLQARSTVDISIAQESFARGDNTVESPMNFTEITTRQYALMHIHAREENYDKALSTAEDLAEKYRAVQFRWLYALVLWEAGEIALKANNKAKAVELLQQAQHEYQEMNIPIYAAQIGEILNNII